MIIYLDQNKWIDLAKSIINPEKNKKYVEVANLVLKKVKNKEWIFPLSVMHVFETTLRADSKSRKKLVNIMTKISDGYSIKSFLDIQKDELMNIFLEVCTKEKIKQIKVIEKNPFLSIGAENILIDIKTDILPVDVKQKIINIIDNHLQKNINSQDITNIILDRYDKEFSDGLIKDDMIMVDLLEKERISLLKLSKKDRYNAFLNERFWTMIKYLKIDIQKLCEKKEDIIPKSILEDKNKLTILLEGAASLNIRTKLSYELLKDKERPIQRHDNRDITFLSTAIPYCDVVITEKTWKHLANINKLNDKYSTIIENDLNYLLTLE